ncbi:hypothetical protein GCK32_003349 [Trichostrongylus colubriformis]|uniref:Uncharacterized protein n=1 Tax=Trichostrongylus colubriformis TaxID=6319 RepID=A0AAN8IHP0_TRICO
MNCTGVLKELITSRGFLAAVGSQAVASIFAAILGAAVLRKCSNLYFHINCKVLIITTVSLNIVHSITIASLQSVQVFRYILYSNPCDAAVSSVFCFCLRFPAMMCLVAFATLQFGMVAERIFALWKRHEYEHYGCRLGTLIASSCILFSIASCIWVVTNIDLTMPTAYCSSSTVETAERLTILCFILCGIDVMSLLGLALLHISNAGAIKRKVFDLRSSYQLHENAAVIRLLLPLTIFETFCHIWVSTTGGVIQLFQNHFSYVMYRTLFAASYIVPYYAVVSPILLWLIITRSKQLRLAKLKALGQRSGNERDLYFQKYVEMWQRD